MRVSVVCLLFTKTPIKMRSALPLLSLMSLVVVITTSCTDTCETTSAYTYYEPVYTPLSEIRSAVGFQESREITQSGKIYLIQEHLLINEPGAGIHIINNENPENPENLGFINIPGNMEMAAVDGFLYADSYTDLVIIDISDLTNPHEINRVEDLFPYYSWYGYSVSEESVVTDLKEVKEKDKVKNLDCEGNGTYYYWGYRSGDMIALYADSGAPSKGGSASSGIGGSMARFTITNDHLYMIDQSEMRIADISTPSEPILGAQTSIGWGIETIFPYGDLLFLGANNGMYIYDVSTPLAPTQLSNYTHINSCDPVVTDGQYAYVTLRSGNECAGFTNQLEVVDIADPSDPELLKTYPMYNPHGLSISGNRLFICDGEAGLKIYDASNVNSMTLIKAYTDIHAFDVIVNDCLVMLIGEDGLHQYHCTEFEEEITYLSTISF